MGLATNRIYPPAAFGWTIPSGTPKPRKYKTKNRKKKKSQAAERQGGGKGGWGDGEVTMNVFLAS
jgi:hypothetical protein